MSKMLAGSKVIRQSCVEYSGYRGTVCPNWTRTDLWGSCRVTGHSTRTAEPQTRRSSFLVTMGLRPADLRRYMSDKYQVSEEFR